MASWQAWLLGSAAVLAAPGAAANPADVFGLGSRSTAMGGAVSADVTDFSASYYNPAGLARARGTDLSVGYMHAAHRLRMNGEDSRVDPVSGLTGGVVAPGLVLGMPFAFGLATHLGDNRISRARTFREDEPRWVLYDNRSQLLYLSTSVALRPWKFLALGGGVAFLAATRGSFGITGRAVLPPGSPSDSQLRHEVDADLSAVRTPLAAVVVMPSDAVRFAAAYRGQAQIDLSIEAQLRGNIDAIGIKIPAYYALASRTVSQFIPRQLVLGTSVSPNDELKLGVDLTYMQWSAYESPVSSSETVLDVRAPKGLPINLPPIPRPSARTPPRFHDTLVPRLGAEWMLRVTPSFSMPARIGYVYERSPVPEQTGTTNFVDSDRHVLSVGTGFAWEHPGALISGDLRFDVHAQWSVLPSRTTLKESAADFTGDYRASGSIFNMGMTLSTGFR